MCVEGEICPNLLRSYINIAVFGYGNSIRRSKVFIFAASAPFADKQAAMRKFLYPIISGIRNIHISAAAYRYTVRRIELPVSCA